MKQKFDGETLVKQICCEFMLISYSMIFKILFCDNWES